MTAYCYRIATNPVKTNLGINFHQSFYCYKHGINTDWLGNPDARLRLIWARLDKVRNTFDNDPSRWNGYIGTLSKQPDGYTTEDAFADKLVVGSQVCIFKQGYPISSYDDTYDPGKYQFTIEKIGRSKWKKVINENRRETEIPLTQEEVPV